LIRGSGGKPTCFGGKKISNFKSENFPDLKLLGVFSPEKKGLQSEVGSDPGNGTNLMSLKMVHQSGPGLE
jgi:hypothetical protein